MKQLSITALDDKEIGYIFGLFEGDGYLFHDKRNRHYSVDFYLNSAKDKDTLEFLLSLLRKIGCNPGLYQDKRYHCVRVRVKSKTFLEFIRDRDIALERDLILGFVSGLIDADGYVNSKKSFIQIVNTKESLLLLTQKMLDHINLRSSISVRTPSKKDKKKSFNLFVTYKFMKTNNISRKTNRQFNSSSEVVA